MAWPSSGHGDGRADGSAPPATVGADAEQTSCVADAHDVVAHGWPEMYADGLKSAASKRMPKIVSATPRETGALSGEKPVAMRAKVGLGVGAADYSILFVPCEYL